MTEYPKLWPHDIPQHLWDEERIAYVRDKQAVANGFEAPHRRGQDHDGLLHRPAPMPETGIQPALTAEEWRAALDNEFTRQQMLAESCDPVLGNDHRRAALSLYGKPFGFDAYDLLTLRRCSEFLSSEGIEDDALDELIAKIRALLPPA